MCAFGGGPPHGSGLGHFERPEQFVVLNPLRVECLGLGLGEGGREGGSEGN